MSLTFELFSKCLLFSTILFRSTSTLSPDELAAQSRSIWPTPTIVLLFSPHFKLINLEYLKQTYEFHGVIASGAFGTVYRVINRNEKKEFALKVLEKSQVNIKTSFQAENICRNPCLNFELTVIEFSFQFFFNLDHPR